MTDTLVAMFLLADPGAGGWPSFTAHLMYGLVDAGYQPYLFKIGKRTEPTQRSFGRGIVYANLSLEDALNAASTAPSVITAVGPKYADAAAALMQAGAGVVIHDPTELKPALLGALEATRRPVVTIRSAVYSHAALAPFERVLVPHPYKRATGRAPDGPTRHATAYSRVDWDKGTHIIVEANQMLPAERQVQIYGAANRMYAHHKLATLDPTWDRNYHGGWPAKSSLWHGVKLAADGQVVVDLSAISGDGGGTQYSFLECWDAGRPLVLNSRWITGNAAHDEVNGAVAAVVDDAEQLAALLSGPVPDWDRDAAEEILRNHDAAQSARSLLAAITG